MAPMKSFQPPSPEVVMKKTVIFFASLFLAHTVVADENNFVNTAAEIQKALLRPKPMQKVKTRGIQTRSVQPMKTRGIKILAKEKDRVVEKTIMVPADEPSRGANLKIEFDVDSHVIRRASYPLLNELGKALTGEQLKETGILIKGHTDSDGTEIHNLRLSLNRGLSVKRYLTTHFGIPSERLKVFGFGETTPLVPNDNAKHKQLNRRVEIETD